MVDRTRPAPSSRLPRRAALATTAFALAATALVASTGSAAAAPTDFLGRWTSTDSDGSHQTVWIRGTSAHQPRNVAVTYRDDVASRACDGDPAKVTGTGRFDEDVLHVRGALTCTPGGNHVHGRIDLGWTYDAGNDTLVGFDGIVWERA